MPATTHTTPEPVTTSTTSGQASASVSLHDQQGQEEHGQDPAGARQEREPAAQSHDDEQVGGGDDEPGPAGHRPQPGARQDQADDEGDEVGHAATLPPARVRPDSWVVTHECSAHTRVTMDDQMPRSRAAVRLARSFGRTALSSGRRWWIGGAVVVVLARRRARARRPGADGALLRRRRLALGRPGARAHAGLAGAAQPRAPGHRQRPRRGPRPASRRVLGHEHRSAGQLADPHQGGDRALALRAVRAAAPPRGAGGVPDDPRRHPHRAHVRHRHLPRAVAGVPRRRWTCRRGRSTCCWCARG